MKKLSAILLAFVLICTVSSCTKKSSCEMVEGRHFTGYYEYYANPNSAGIYAWNSIAYNKTPNGYLCFENGLDNDYVGLDEKSIPREYRKDGLKMKVNVAYKTISPRAGIPEDVKYKLLCIEEEE